MNNKANSTPCTPPSDSAHVLMIGCAPTDGPDISGMLQREGYTVWRAETAAEADTVIGAHKVVAAVLQAPPAGSAVSGLDIARHLRNTHPGDPFALLLLAPDDAEVQRLLDNPLDGWVDVLSPPWNLRLLQQKLAMFAALHRDREQCHAQRDEFLRARKLNAMMIAVLTHDLRTPMTAVELSAEIVEKRAENDSVRKAVMRIRSSIARMVGTIQHLISITNVDSDLVPTRPEPADLREVAAEVIAEFQAAKPGSAVTLQWMGDTHAVFDIQRIAQVFSNLIGLAVEHAGPDAAVSVKVDGAHRAYVRLSVVTDVVFPEAVRASLFTPLAPPGTDAAPGVGLGLSIVEQLVRAHGGTVVGTSEPTRGTVFDVMLPRVDAPPVTPEKLHGDTP